MIPELLLLAAHAEEPAPPPPEPPAPPAPSVPAPDAPPAVPDPEDDDLSRYRLPFQVLMDRAIGTTSTAVEFDWRKTKLQVGGAAGVVTEFNNFQSARGGAAVRLPAGGALAEVGVSWTDVWATPSSELLALTPYRQPGRPSRIDVDLGASLPLAEGVVTARPRWFPAVQVVFSAIAGVRYSVYPTGWAGLAPGAVAEALVAPSLSDAEVDNLEAARLGGMEVDRGRYGLVAGIGNELYFKRRLFLSPRVVLAVPLLAPASQTELLFWTDLSVAFGIAL